jgi:3',5'-cyclic AMP phosphodiesterase CpdA
MRIAHLSDPHILDLTGVDRSRLLLNKRFTGWVNIKLHRGSVHKRQVVEAMMDDIRAQNVDHVVITGDITNLALEPEFERAKSVFDRIGFHPDQVSVIPGNHDVYTRGSERSRRFAQFFSKNISSDLPVSDDDHPSGPFPFVRLRGDVAIIGLSTAVARLPLLASGQAGKKQLEALVAILEHPEVAKRTPVLLMHHPLVNPPGYVATWTHGLVEATRIRKILHKHHHTVVLHGHLHDRAHRVLSQGGSTLHHLGATSASLLHRSPDRVAGYNVYEIGGGGLESVHARIYDASNRSFVERNVPRKHAAFAT